jgi:hypothetical protein
LNPVEQGGFAGQERSLLPIDDAPLAGSDMAPMPGIVTIQGYPNPAAYRQIAGKVPPLPKRAFPHHAAKSPKWLTNPLDYCALHPKPAVVNDKMGYL